jgi:hypothetical protein
MPNRYARLLRHRSYPALDPTIAYRVLRDTDVAGYARIEAPGRGDPFLSPNELTVFLREF